MELQLVGALALGEPWCTVWSYWIGGCSAALLGNGADVVGGDSVCNWNFVTARNNVLYFPASHLSPSSTATPSTPADLRRSSAELLRFFEGTGASRCNNKAPRDSDSHRIKALSSQRAQDKSLSEPPGSACSGRTLAEDQPPV